MSDTLLGGTDTVVGSTEVATGAVGATTSPGTEAPTTTPAEGAASDTPVYTVRVGGVEEQVTLDELLSGHMRQADYTRKTQELAQQRAQLTQYEALSKALEENPTGTIRALADALQIDLSGAPSADEVDPVLAKLNSLESRFAQADQTAAQQRAAAEAQARIETDLASLHQTHGEFDDGALVKFAVENQIPNLNAAYGAFKFDQDRQAALRAQAVEAERQRVAEAKRTAGFVEGGHARNAGSTSAATTGKPSVREALLSALKAHGAG